MPFQDLHAPRPGSGGLVVVAGVAAVAGLGLWIASRSGGNGGGGPGNAATPAGTISDITLSQPQVARQVRPYLLHPRMQGLRTQLAQGPAISKTSDETIRVNYTAVFATQDPGGNAISWPYLVATALFSEVNGQQIGVSLIFEGNFPNGQVTRHDEHVIPIATPPGTLIVGRVLMVAAESDGAGNPDSTRQVILADLSSTNVVQIVSSQPTCGLTQPGYAFATCDRVTFTLGPLTGIAFQVTGFLPRNSDDEPQYVLQRESDGQEIDPVPEPVLRRL